jgi:hypothetical protein
VSTRAPGPRLDWLVLGGALLLGICCAWLASDSEVDDALIVHRYVDRFLEGKGLTFNDGEYVEGYTSLLWTLLLSLGALSHLSIESTSLGLSYGSLALMILAVGRLVRVLRLGRAVEIPVLALLVCNFLFLRTAFLGLELGLFAALLTLFVSVSFELLTPSAARIGTAPLWAGGLGGLLFVTRPESVVLVPALLLAAGVSAGRRAARPVGISLLIFAVAVGTVTAWRLQYYGALLPNSVVAKSESVHLRGSLFALRSHVADGAEYLVATASENPVLPVVAALWLLAMFSARARRLELRLLLIPVAWSAVVVVGNGGDWMPHHRLINMYWPIYVVAMAVGLAASAARIPRKALVVGLVALCVLEVGTTARAAGVGPFREPGRSRWWTTYGDIGRSLDGAWIKGDILAAEGIGLVGYRGPSIYVHDPSGLTDYRLARDAAAQRSVYGRTDWKYSMGLDPSVVILHSIQLGDRWRNVAVHFRSDYRLFLVPPPEGRSEGWLYLIIREDRLPVYLPVVAHLSLREVDCPECRGGTRKR